MGSIENELRIFGKRRHRLRAEVQEISQRLREVSYEGFFLNMDYREVYEATGINPSMAWRLQSDWQQKRPRAPKHPRTLRKINDHLQMLGTDFREANEVYEEVNSELRQRVIKAHLEGVPKKRIARFANVTYPTVRMWTGETQTWNPTRDRKEDVK